MSLEPEDGQFGSRTSIRDPTVVTTTTRVQSGTGDQTDPEKFFSRYDVLLRSLITYRHQEEASSMIECSNEARNTRTL